MRSRALHWAVAGGVTLLACTSTPSSVERLDGGQAWRGRYIDAVSYAWYARGAHLEARGQLQAAEAAFSNAAEQDPDSGSIWARIGAIRCARGEGDADDAFARGWETGNDASAVLIERGKCSLGRQRFEAALEDGLAAVRRTPRSIEASLLVVDALLGLGREPDALRWLDSLAAFLPGASRVQSRRISTARQRNDTSRERRAREIRATLTSAARLEPSFEDPELAARGRPALDDALTAGDLELALQRGTALGMRPAEIALRALALGQPKLGRELADFALAADPADADGLVALVVARELLGSTDWDDVTTRTGDDARELVPLHPLAILLLGELLDRRAGPEAANLWRQGYVLTPSSDPLVERLRMRQPAPPSQPRPD